MGERCRILTTPVRVAGGVPLSHLRLLVAADATRRWLERDGVEVEWQAPSVSGGLAGQYALELELAREGHDRETVGRDEFVQRIRDLEAEGRRRLDSHLGSLGIEVDLDVARLDAPGVVTAAATAFVRLYEEGLIRRAERVVSTCPRCATVVEGADAVSVHIDDERLRVRVTTAAGVSLDLDVSSPELLPGAVAVAVPVDHPAAGDRVAIPISAQEVGVVGLDSISVARPVVPAHDPGDLELARAMGLPTPEVLDGQGVVRTDGPLAGLGRFAARAAARETLAAEGVLVDVETVAVSADLCRCCGTVLVPRLGRHWFLSTADLEVAAADVAREGLVTFGPGHAVDAYVERAGKGDDWCLSHQVGGGIRVPAAMCLGCGTEAVSVTEEESCHRCMGDLVHDHDALDARFVGSVWPLAASGWPAADVDPDVASRTTLAVSASGLQRWALPMAALSIRLAGRPVFGHVAVQGSSPADSASEPLTPDDLGDLVLEHGARPVRAALLSGHLDVEQGCDMVAALDHPAVGDLDVEELRASCDAMVAAGAPSLALGALVSAAERGVPTGVSLGAIAAPLLGT